MDPNVWGRFHWKVLNHLASFYDSDRYDVASIYYRFINQYQKVLPCKSCRTHFLEYLDEGGLQQALTSKILFHQWLNYLKAKIAKRKNRPSVPMVLIPNDRPSSLPNKSEFWAFLFSIVLVYPESPSIDTINDYLYFFNYLSEIVPLKRPSGRILSQSLNSREDLVDWVFRLYQKYNTISAPPSAVGTAPLLPEDMKKAQLVSVILKYFPEMEDKDVRETFLPFTVDKVGVGRLGTVAMLIAGVVALAFFRS